MTKLLTIKKLKEVLISVDSMTVNQIIHIMDDLINYHLPMRILNHESCEYWDKEYGKIANKHGQIPFAYHIEDKSKIQIRNWQLNMDEDDIYHDYEDINEWKKEVKMQLKFLIGVLRIK